LINTNIIHEQDESEAATPDIIMNKRAYKSGENSTTRGHKKNSMSWEVEQFNKA